MPHKKTTIAKQVEQEHACLKRDIGIIKKEVVREVLSEDFSEWRLEFMWRLRDLRNHLCKHFDLEEEGGFMSEIMEEVPEAIHKVRQLETEHGEILSNLDDILSNLKAIQAKDDVMLAEADTSPSFGTMADLTSLQVNPAATLDVEIFVASV